MLVIKEVNMKSIRHGDVYLKRIDKLPKGVISLKDKTLVYGEVTGHSHRFVDTENINRYQLNDKVYLEVMEPSLLTHEEHNKWQMFDVGIGGYTPHDGYIMPGVYEQIPEREWDYIGEEAKKVID